MESALRCTHTATTHASQRTARPGGDQRRKNQQKRTLCSFSSASDCSALRATVRLEMLRSSRARFWAVESLTSSDIARVPVGSPEVSDPLGLGIVGRCTTKIAVSERVAPPCLIDVSIGRRDAAHQLRVAFGEQIEQLRAAPLQHVRRLGAAHKQRRHAGRHNLQQHRHDTVACPDESATIRNKACAS